MINKYNNDYRLNVFSPITTDGKEYTFGIEGDLSSGTVKKYALTKEQESTLEEMINGKEYTKEYLIEKWGKETLEDLIKKGTFINYQIDTEGIYSRSKAYYSINKYGNVQEKLSAAKVLILGCGGIGSHVAWNLTVLGVGEITLVDFDVVEESNLNRQLLYTKDDIGNQKVEVLGEKLKAINPNIVINIKKMKISSSEELDELCKQYTCNLIIKTLDSPKDFSKWLDEICKLRKICYITGITTSIHSLIGPTFIPDKSKGFSEIFNVGTEFETIVGTMPSLGIVMYHISSEISQEAFKILAGVGTPKYINKILAEDIIIGKSMYIYPKNINLEKDPLSKAIFSNVNFMFLFGIVLAFAFTQLPWLPLVGYLCSILFALFTYETIQERVKCALVNNTIYMLFNLVTVISLNGENLGILEILISILIIISISSIFTCFITQILHIILDKTKHILSRSNG
ncbi:HesA/MoeB/ThiF family protein [Lachnoclostridium phytofermentans]|uniref:UBA/THIF-type NAD/FAD binding protein n=1 Tax=Lachnoclostridium phytofermentans (strain ATCC 700394 / DSM 18823 / ISDg) TaxID=357809 RepID=A9KIR4_LACP7|nr:ThiF family adenylyltransferase [Lachnoclostridium phytofermentans]ABX43927.1 UBA/THIF-type NAD/FAD binding protein [Lachnoclostridium phytofermentans ISDg]